MLKDFIELNLHPDEYDRDFPYTGKILLRKDSIISISQKFYGSVSKPVEGSEIYLTSAEFYCVLDKVDEVVKLMNS